MRQSGELTFEEIAQRRGSPVGTGKTLMRAAVSKLRRMLDDEPPPDNFDLPRPSRELVELPARL